MFLECNNHEAHGPTDYHAYICTYAIYHIQYFMFSHPYNELVSVTSPTGSHRVEYEWSREEGQYLDLLKVQRPHILDIKHLHM